MLKRMVSGIVLTLLLIGMLTLALDIQAVKSDWTWTETIYIRADGSIDPPTAPISTVDNVTYTLTDNIVVDIFEDLIVIVVERNNIVVDGAGYTLQGSHWGCGINLSGKKNVTIKNTEIRQFDLGIYLNSSSDISIYNNDITLSDAIGIIVQLSSNNDITTNNIKYNYIGIRLEETDNNCISGNQIAENGPGGGMFLFSSTNNSMFRNNVTKNWIGIGLGSSSEDNVITENVVSANLGSDISISSSDNSIFHNDLDNRSQIFLSGSFNNLWDDGYPSGGNFWSDYTGVDEKSGSGQDQPGCDGIGDTPYIIDEANQDNYPLMKPYAGPHDIGVTDVVTSKTIVGQGYDLHMNVTIVNYGIQTESFNVTVYLNNNLTMPTEDDTEDAWLVEKTVNSIHAVDEDWNTYVKGNTSEIGWRAYVYENFTVPPVVGGAKWTGKYLTTFSPDWGSSNVDVYCYDYDSESWTQILSTYATNYEDAIKNWTVTIPDNCLNETLMVKTELRKRDPFCVGFCPTDWYFEGKVSWLYTNISLPSRKSMTITFTWDSTGFAKGNYTISAYVTPVPGETDLIDNNFTDGTIALTILGDLNNDCIVDISDVVLVTAVYRSKCGDPGYRPNSDIIEDCVIDIADVVAVTSHYRETC